MGKVGRSQASRAMAEAFELGVTHFDVARSYGFGRAEQVVGEFIKGRRDRVTVTTKFGVVPPQLRLRTKAMIPVARLVVSLLPQVKARLKSKSGQLLAERNFSVAYARQCLYQSLTALATDYIDIYLIHEPEAASLGEMEQLNAFLEESVQAGKIRRWGFAYQTPQDNEWASSLAGDVIQFEGNLQTVDACGPLIDVTQQRIVTRPFGGDLNQISAIDAIAGDSQVKAALTELDATLADLSLCLANRLAGPEGSILCSMFSINHIRSNVQTLKRFSDDKQMNQIINAILNSLPRDVDYL
jgi:hypothetical protein